MNILVNLDDTYVIDAIGYLALTINLYSMCTKGESKLRIFSTIANLIYIIYGILLGTTPIIVGCTIAVILHTYRLSKLNN